MRIRWTPAFAGERKGEGEGMRGEGDPVPPRPAVGSCFRRNDEKGGRNDEMGVLGMMRVVEG